MGMSPALFVCLFLAALGVFFLGAGCLWWGSLQAQAQTQAMKAQRKD